MTILIFQTFQKNKKELLLRPNSPALNGHDGPFIIKKTFLFKFNEILVHIELHQFSLNSKQNKKGFFDNTFDVH